MTASRRSTIVGILVLLGLLAPGSAFAADLLPDLGMARIADIKNDRLPDGRRVIRYTSIITNTGRGPFELHGQRSSTSSEMSVTQRIFDSAGGSTYVATPATMFFAGDGHSHWHVRNLESSELVRLDNGKKVGTWAKQGFCFSDNYRYRTTIAGAAQNPVYTGCGHAADLSVDMGLSIGWGDAYYWSLPDQYIDVTGLGAGRYRLYATADAQGWFRETSTTNNTTWVDLQLKGNGAAKVLGYGPAS